MAKEKIQESVQKPIQEPVKDYGPDLSKWDDFEYSVNDRPDFLSVPKELIPDGFDYLWVAKTVYGQPSDRFVEFQRGGWREVPAMRHDGMFMPKGHDGHIEKQGLVLMERPLVYSQRAKEREKAVAIKQVRDKEAQLQGGVIDGVTLDTQHPSARNFNRVNRTIEPMPVPKD